MNYSFSYNFIRSGSSFSFFIRIRIQIQTLPLIRTQEGRIILGPQIWILPELKILNSKLNLKKICTFQPEAFYLHFSVHPNYNEWISQYLINAEVTLKNKMIAEVTVQLNIKWLRKSHLKIKLRLHHIRIFFVLYSSGRLREYVIDFHYTVHFQKSNPLI